MGKFAVICDKKGAVVEEYVPHTVDCYIFVDPLTLFLVTNNFMSQWKALLTGKLLIWGKRPWMILKLKDLFPTP